MALASLRTVLDTAALVRTAQFDQRRTSWRAIQDAEQDETKKVSLLAFLQEQSGIPAEVFLEQIAKAIGLPFLRRLRRAAELDKDLGEGWRKQMLTVLSSKVAFQYNVAPTVVDERRVQVAVSDPFDAHMLQAVHFAVQRPVEYALAPKDEIQTILKEYYGMGAATLDQMSGGETGELDLPTDKEIAEGDQEASVIKFVNQIIWEAHNSKSTDIHFEPMEDELRIRYRIDGILHKQPMPEQLKRFLAAILSRIKVMSGMNIAEKRLPQDGRINVRIKGEELDIRVSTVPTVYGESVSLRLLSRGRASFNMRNLGLSDLQRLAIEKIILKPHGIFLVTGPTGSGKSTSLYAFLSEINKPTKRIITIEEPVEYEIAGVNQIAVRPEIGLSFAVGLRHILRQDPNVVMVGEIRDLETAEIAIRAALTGHLVFSTLHTNDAPSAFTRLIDMGIEPFLVASSVEAVMAQRLVRTICHSCKTAQRIEKDYLRHIGFPEDRIDTTTFYRGPGCDDCRQLGYQGRIGIYELLVLTEELRPLVLSRTSASVIAQKALELGMLTLRMDGWDKVSAGTTTIEEVLRVTQSEEHLAALMDDKLSVVTKS
jgi:type II secretory ATPase GspE/PulE/Tfp pilus assembly ATPase PilB-like protein